MESRTNKMVLLWARQDKVCKTRWHHSRQPRELSVSHSTLVQEGNGLSYARRPAKGLPGRNTHDIGTQTGLQGGHAYR